jgi:hypothetical protein
MSRRKLTLEELVAKGVFNPGNNRHRRALDESEQPLSDPELEELRTIVVWLRGERGAKTQSAKMLQKFAAAVSRQRSRSRARVLGRPVGVGVGLRPR